MNEQEWIDRYVLPRKNDVHPLAGPGDDAALIQPPEGEAQVLSVDTLVSGQHFQLDWLQDWHPPQVLARRLLRGSFSDLSAMGATATGVLLSLESDRLPGALGDDFWTGIDEELASHSLLLLGGNLTRCRVGLSLHATVVGHVKTERTWRRDSARPGDRIAVTGYPGKAAQALEHLCSGRPVPEEDPWRSPSSRQDFVRCLSPILDRPACAIDLSDGLGLDLQRVCQASQVSAEVDILELISGEGAPLLQQVIGGGEDYELLLAIDPKETETVERAARETNTPLRWLGTVTEKTETPGIHWHHGGETLRDLPTQKGWDPFR